MDLVVRIITTAGRSRIVAKANDTLSSLKGQVALHLNVPKEEIVLCFDPAGNQCITGDSRLLSALGIKSGSVLHLKSKTAPLVKGVDISPAKHLTTADLPPAPPKTSPESEQKAPPKTSKEHLTSEASSSSSASPAPNVKDKANDTPGGKKAVFLSFDSFLEKRNYLTSDLPGCISYAPLPLEMGRMNKLPPSATLKHQAYRHVDHLEFMNLSEVNEFVSYWKYSLTMVTPRMGWMYGYYREDTHYHLGYRAVMEGIYEPPQITNGDQVQLLDDPFLKTVDKITSHLGFERIGMILTSLPKEGSLTSLEALQIAKHQLNSCTDEHFTSYPFVNKFVTCIVTPCAEAGGEPVPNAFMVSDMGMAFVRDGILDDTQPDLTHMKVKGSTKGELYPQILESGKPTQKFDVDWLVVKVNNSAPKKVRSRFRFAKFPRENRLTPITTASIKSYMKGVGLKTSISWEKYSDFHLILHVAKILDLDTAIAICSAIVSETEVDPALEELLTSLG